MKTTISIVVVIFILWLWLRGGLSLCRIIAPAGIERLWPRKWLLLSFVPFVGRSIFARVMASTAQNTSLKLSAEKTSKFHPDFQFDAVRWILMEEQYDLKTSDHHGTRLHGLNNDSIYRIVTAASSSENSGGKENEIGITTPRPVRQRKEWARLEYDGFSNQWKLTNLNFGTIIPVVAGKEKTTIKYCEHSRSELLSSGSSFIVGSSDFRLTRLPPLAVFWKHKGKCKFATWEKDDVSCGSLSDNTIIVDLPSVAGHHWAIRKDKLICKASINYKPLGAKKTISLGNGASIILSPGDVFRIPSLPMVFTIDYMQV